MFNFTVPEIFPVPYFAIKLAQKGKMDFKRPFGTEELSYNHKSYKDLTV